MSDHKRLTKQAGWHKDIDLKDELGYSYIYQRLAELENKIEQGTLIEFPRMFKAIDRTGWIVEFIDESGCVGRNHFFHEEKAIERLKELQNGRN